MKVCFKCKTAVSSEKIMRGDECPSCGTDLRVCLNCEFYEEGRANSCREQQAEPVKEKDRANFCDFFRFRERTDRETQKASGKEEAERRWKELFKK